MFIFCILNQRVFLASRSSLKEPWSLASTPPRFLLFPMPLLHIYLLRQMCTFEASNTEMTTVQEMLSHCTWYSEAIPSKLNQQAPGTQVRKQLHNKYDRTSSTDSLGVGIEGAYSLLPSTSGGKGSIFFIMLSPHSAIQQIFTKHQRTRFPKFGVVSLLITSEFFLCSVICTFGLSIGPCLLRLFTIISLFSQYSTYSRFLENICWRGGGGKRLKKEDLTLSYTEGRQTS